MRWNPAFRNAFKNRTKIDLSFVVRCICRQSTTSIGFSQFNFVFSPWEPLFASRGASQIVGLLFLDFNSVFQGNSYICCQKLETRALQLRSQLSWYFGFLKMESILASFFRQHQEQEAWWYKVKIAPNVASASAEVTNLKPGEAPLEHCISKLLGITMIELWEVLFECDLARKRGKQYH